VLRIVTRDALPAPLPLCPASEVPDGKGTVVLTVGCPPKGAPLPISEVVQAVRLISKPGEEGKARCWETAKGQLAGRSGGPMLDRQGRLLGVASGASSGKGYYVHVEEIRAFLKEKKLEWPGSGQAPADRLPSAAVADYVNPYGRTRWCPAPDASLCDEEATVWIGK
jgi:hypothetical protein